jgi:1-acyl-sn-glycerol-3-phosphate acyltransferase
MNQKGRKRARALARILAPEEYVRFKDAKINDLGFGYDPFGLEIESAMAALSVAKLIYKYWFRVESYGVENVPLEGSVMITPNHSGALPLDALMVGVDLAVKMKKPRIMRAVVDNFAGFLPFVNTFFYRCGQIIGARRNFEELLQSGEMVTVFPEGDKGTGKPFKDRYKMVPFNVGFMELSLLNRTPIVPAAVIGAEEQYPYMFNMKPFAKLFSLPYFPVTPLVLLLGPLGILPLPTKYYIYYGEPLHLYRDYPPETVKDPETIRKLVGIVQGRVQDLIDQGLENRKEDVFGFSLKDFLPGQKGPKGPAGERKQIRQRTGA